jgi:hypothetical protein
MTKKVKINWTKIAIAAALGALIFVLGITIATYVGYGDRFTVVIALLAIVCGVLIAFTDTRIKKAETSTDAQYKLITKELKRDTDLWAVFVWGFGTPGLVKTMLSVPTNRPISGWLLLLAVCTALAGLIGAYNSLLKYRLSSLELKQEHIAQKKAEEARAEAEAERIAQSNAQQSSVTQVLTEKEHNA